MKRQATVAALTAFLIAGTFTGYAQELTGPPADPQFKYSTPMPPDVAVPATVETRLGTLRFEGGVPDAVELTANDNTPYTWFSLDLRNGPLVLKVPPKVLGLINDMWYRGIA